MNNGEFFCHRCRDHKSEEEMGGVLAGKYPICLDCNDKEDQDKLIKEKKGFNRRKRTDDREKL